MYGTLKFNYTNQGLSSDPYEMSVRGEELNCIGVLAQCAIGILSRVCCSSVRFLRPLCVCFGGLCHLISRRDSPVRGQIYLLKIASMYGHFTPIGA